METGSSQTYGEGATSGTTPRANSGIGGGSGGSSSGTIFNGGKSGAAGIVVVQHIDLRPVIGSGTATLASEGVGSGSSSVTTPPGASAVTQRGFLVAPASNTNPVLGQAGVLSFLADTAGTGAFTAQMTSLLSNTYYTVRPFAVNAEGTGYGTPITLNTAWYAGLYIQDFQAYATTVTDLGDGSKMSGGECDIVTHANIAGGAQKVLRLLNDGTQNARNAFFLPDLNPGQAIRSFRASFDVHFMDSAGGADNLAINFGTVRANPLNQDFAAGGPQGNDYGAWSSNTNNNGPILSVAWDTFNNGSTNRNKGTRVVLNGNLLTNNNTIAPHVPNTYSELAYRRADIVWEDGKISVAYNGQVLCSNLPTTFGGTNFVPVAGDIFCFTATSGANDMHASIDNLRVETSTNNFLPVPGTSGSAPTLSYGGNRSLPLQQAVTIQPSYGGGPTKAATAFSVTSFAGSGNRLNMVDAQGTNAQIMYPAGLAVDRNGFVYAAQSAGVDGTGRHTILKISPEGLVWTLAGSGSSGGNNSTNGPRDVTFNNPTGVAVDTNGNVYVADCDSHRIRRLTPAGASSTFAGGATGLNDGTGTSAQFDFPEGICIDPAGQYLYVAQSANDQRGTTKASLNWGYHSIRRVTISNAVVTTIAGNGQLFGYADGAGTNAQFATPSGVATDGSFLYVSEATGNRIRKINLSNNTVSTLAGATNGNIGTSGATDGVGTAARFNRPRQLAIDKAGRYLYVAESTNHRIRRIDLVTSNVETVAGSGVEGVANGTGTNATFAGPYGIAISPDGTAYVSHSVGSGFGHRIRKMELTGYSISPTTLPAGLTFNPTTGVISGTPTAGFAATTYTVTAANVFGTTTDTFTLSVPTDLSANFAEASTVPLTVSSYSISGQLTLSLGFAPAPGQILTLVNNTGAGATTGNFTSLTEGATTSATYNGDTFYFKISYQGGDGNDVTLARVAGPGQVENVNVSTLAGNGSMGSSDGAGAASTFTTPWGLALDSSGNLVVADRYGHRIRNITPAGQVSTLAGNTRGFTNATGTAAQFQYPAGVAVDASGNVYVGDQDNNQIRRVTPAGVVTTLAGDRFAGTTNGTGTNARFTQPSGLAIDRSGNLYVGDTRNHLIRKITSGGVVTTLAGSTIGSADGTNAGAQFNFPGQSQLAVDGSGNVYVADTGNHRIRKITSTGVVTTLAGSSNGIADGTGVAARFNSPMGVAVDGAGNIFVADFYNHRIRKVTSGGVVTTLAGGLSGFADGNGSSAQFSGPAGIVVDAAGTIYVSDANNNRIRKLTTDFRPILTLGAASQASTGISVAGTVNPNGLNSTARFLYGTNQANLNLSASVALSPLNGTNAQAVSAVLTGLVPNTTYFFRLEASNVDGTATSTIGSARAGTYPQPQTITFGSLPAKTYGDAAFTLNATATSTLPVTYTSSDTNVATISSNTVTIRGGGTTTITARQAGNSSFSAALDVPQTLTVAKKVLTVTADNKTRVYGAANPTFTASYSGFVAGDSTANSLTGVPAFSCPATPTSAAAPYPITVTPGTLASTRYSFAFVDGTLTVTDPVPATFSWGGLSQTYSSNPPVSMPIMRVQYDFNNNFNPSVMGMPSLVETNPLGTSFFTNEAVRGVNETVYRWQGNGSPSAQQGGLTLNVGTLLTSNQLTTNSYSVEMMISVDRSSGWRRLIDVEDHAADNGFYINPSSHLAIYPVSGNGGALVSTGNYHHVVLTVAPSNRVSGYINGSPDFTATTPLMNIRPTNPLLHFFLDDYRVQGEYTAGKIAYLRIYDVPLTGAQVLALAGQAGTLPAGPNSIGASVTTQPSGVPVVITYQSGTNPATTNVPTEPGTYTVVATALSPYSGSSTNTFVIAKRSQTVTFSPLTNSVPLKQLANLNVGATASSGLPVTLSLGAGSAATLGGTLTNGSGVLNNIQATGTVYLRAVQAGDSFFEAATNTLTIDVTKNNQSLTFDQDLSEITYSNGLSIALTASASSSLPVTYSVVSGPATVSGNSLQVTGAGLITVQAQQTGDASYNAASPITRTFNVNKATQALTFSLAGLPTVTYGDGPVDLAPYLHSAPFGVSRLLSVVTGPATLNGTVLTVTGAGAVELRVVQPETANFLAAGPVDVTLNVAKKTVSVTANDVSRPAGQPNPAFEFTYSGLLPGDVLLAPPAVTTSATEFSPVGTYSLSPSGAVSDNYFFSYNPGTLTVTQASSAAGFTWSPQIDPIEYGTALSLTQLSAFNDAVPGTITYSPTGGTVLPAGTNPVVATFTPSDTNSFSVASITNQVVVTPAVIEVRADALSKTAGENDPTLTYLVAGNLVGADTLTGTLTRASGEGRGTYAIGQGSLAISPSSSAGNYNLQFIPADFTITADVISLISSYDGTNTVPAVEDYLAAGVNGVDAGNVAAINTAIAFLSSGATDTKDEIQAVVDAYLAILGEAAEGQTDLNTSSNPTFPTYQAIGVNLGTLTATYPTAIGLINDVVRRQGTFAVDTLAEVQALTGIVERLMITAAGGTPSPALTVGDLTLIGITGVTTGNLATFLTNVAATADDGTGINTFTKLQAIAQNQAAALLAIGNAAGGNNATESEPSAGTYATAGVTGVNAGNLAAINSALNTDGITSAMADTAPEIQAIVDAYNAILGAADGNKDGDTGPTAAQYTAIGVTGVSGAGMLSLLGDLIDGLSSTQVGTVAQVQAYADAVKAVMDAAAGQTGKPSLADLELLGISGVTADNLADIQAAIRAGGAASVDTMDELTSVVSTTATTHALAAIGNAAGGNSATASSPTLANYQAIGVTGVDANNLAAINSALNSSGVGSGEVDTAVKIQTIVDAYNAILAVADGSADNDTAPSPAQYALIGVTGVSGPDMGTIAALMGSVIDRKAVADVDSISELQALADAVVAVVAAGNGTSGVPTKAQLELLGITGVTDDNLAAIQAALRTTGLSGLDSFSELQAVATTTAGTYGALAVIRDYDGSNTTPTSGDYTNAGVTGVDGSNLAAINTAIAFLGATATDSAAEIQAVVDAYRAILGEANGTTADADLASNPTLADYITIGVNPGTLGSYAGGLGLLNTVVGGRSSLEVDTLAEVQALASVVERLMITAGGGTPSPALTDADFTLIGITGVTAGNVESILAAVAGTANDGSGIGTLAQLQAVADAYAAVLAAADGTANGATKPSAAQYGLLGVTGVTLGSFTNLLGDVIDGKSSGDVDSPSEIQALANAVQALFDAANGALGKPTKADLALLGLTGVTDANLHLVQEAIRNAGGIASVDSLTELNNVIGPAVTTLGNALAKISGAAEGNSATASSPTLADYADATVTGVTSSNLAAINDALNSAAVNGQAADSKAEIQAIVDAVNAVLAAADGAANGATKPTGPQYGRLGVTGVSGSAAINLLGEVIDGKAATAVDTVAEIQSLASAVAGVMAGAERSSGRPTLSNLTALGVTGANNSNLARIQQAIADTDDDGSQVDTQTELQALVTGVLNSISSALTTIGIAADNNNAVSTSLADSVYADAGVTGVDVTNVGAINSVLDLGPFAASEVNSTEKVQTIVDAYNAILGAADGLAGNGILPTALQYAQIGVLGQMDMPAPILLGDVIDGLLATSVDTVDKVQNLANAVWAVLDGAAGLAGYPPLADLQALGITGVNSSNLAAVQAAIAATADDGSGVDTRAKLQAVVTGVAVDISNALAVIGSAAQNNSATGTSPSAATYAGAGVAGVDANNLTAINTFLNTDNVNLIATDTTAKVQTIVDAYVAVAGLAGGGGGTNPGNFPNAAAYTVLGITGVTDGPSATLLGSVIDVKASGDVDSATELQALATAVRAVLDAANGAAGVPSLAQLQLLGLTGVTAENLAAVRSAIVGTADNGSGVDSLSSLQTLVDGVTSTALAVISGAAENNSATATSPSVADYGNAGVTGVDVTNLAAINTVLNLSSVNGVAVDTTTKVQTIVDAYLAILGAADGSADGDPAPTGVQYSQIGVTGVNTSAAVSLLGSVIDAKSGTDVNTVAKVQGLADAVKAVLDYASGASATAPTLSQLQLLGITGLSTGSVLDGYLAALLAGGSAGADSLAELQAVEVWVPVETKVGTVTEATAPATGVTVNFVGTPGQAYRVSATSSLNSSISWSVIGTTHTADATTGALSIVDANALPTTLNYDGYSETVLRRFYKFEIRIR